MAVKLGGNNDEEVEELASLGAYGTAPGHVHRDLERRFCSTMWSPMPRLVKIPCIDNKGDHRVQLETQTRVYLLSDWLSALANNPSVED
eukprot:13446545-Alexandrium_andersonii.AAC.1